MADNPKPREVVKHSVSKVQTMESTAHLLGIPAELREGIWILAVTDEDAIDVDAMGFARPKLLETCKQIRSEALKLFYHSNRFGFRIIAYEDTELLKFNNVLKAVGVCCKDTHLQMFSSRPSPNWGNLIAWLANLHAGRHRFGCARFDAGTAEWHIIEGLFHMVAALRDVEWERVKEAVEFMRPALVASDAKWAE